MSRFHLNGLYRFGSFALLAVMATATQAEAPLATPQVGSAEMRRLADWAVATDDTGGRPFVIIDKRDARVFAFDPRGALVGASPALLGLTRGDDNIPGIGSLRLAQITPAQRITPAGRFEAHLGTNLGGHRILWIDYESALSLHPVVTGSAGDRRFQRLASVTALDNRISYGCINVPATFYASVIQPLFSPANGIVYILPETRAFHDLFSLRSTERGDAAARR